MVITVTSWLKEKSYLIVTHWARILNILSVSLDLLLVATAYWLLPIGEPSEGMVAFFLYLFVCLGNSGSMGQIMTRFNDLVKDTFSLLGAQNNLVCLLEMEDYNN